LLKPEKEEEMNTLNLSQLTRGHWIALGLLLLIGAAWLCKPRTGATAQAVEQSFFAPEVWAQEFTTGQGWYAEHPRLLADVNGDGRQDVVGFAEDGVWLGTSTGTSFIRAFALAEFGIHQGWRVDKHVRATGDINGDRMEDVVGFADDGVYRALSTGSGLTAATKVVANFGYNQGWRVDKHVRLLADVSGDGRKDIVAFGNDGVWLSLARPGGFFTAPAFVVREFGHNQGWTPDRHIRTTADVNGDGRQDIVAFGRDGVWIALSTGTGFGPAEFVLAEFGYAAGNWRVDRHPRLLADINRDGKQDIVAFGADGVWTARSTGGGFEAGEFILANFGYKQGWRVGVHPRFVADFNGDGYQDIVGFGDESVYRALGGSGGFEPLLGVLRDLVAWQGYPHDTPSLNQDPEELSTRYPRLAGDFNGDGMQDLIAFDRDHLMVVRSSNLPPPPPPAAPSNVRITGATTSSLSIAWKDNSDDERRFFINYNGQTAFAGVNTTTKTVSGLTADTQYCFTVRAESIWGVSAESRFACGRTNFQQPTPTPTPTPTPQPQGFSSVQVFNCKEEEFGKRHDLHIWTLNVEQNIWIYRGVAPSLWNGNSCPLGAPFVFPLEDGHSFLIRAVDPLSSFCGGRNDPLDTGCVRAFFTQPVPGNAKGPALRWNIGF
jgi:hypothetical protein